MSNLTLTPRTVAAVDLGSNSFHMIVAEVDGHGHLQVVDRMREMVRLGAGLDEQQNLTKVARQRAMACLHRFGQRLKSLPAGSVRAVGTNTLRQLRDSKPFLQEAQRALGHPIEIIAGREEARLVYLGVAHGLAAKEERRLVVDIGGGSTELIIGEGFNSLKCESLHMGCVSMSQRFFEDGEITAARMKKAELACAVELRPYREEYRAARWTVAVGSSGTIRAIREVVKSQGWSQQGISCDSLERLHKALMGFGQVDKISFPTLSEERRPVFVGGVMVLYSVFKSLNIERMLVSDLALREGLLYDMIGRIRHEDVRDRTVAALALRFNVDQDHARRVNDTAQAMLRQVVGCWSFANTEFAEMLGWACALHEVGLTVSHTQYQKHGAYIIQNADLSGFSRQEQAVIAALVGGHRRKFALELFDALPEMVRGCTMRLCVILRLAALLHRSRSPHNAPNPLLRVDGQNLELRFPEGWLKNHPLSRAELQEEIKRLKLARFKLKIL